MSSEDLSRTGDKRFETLAVTHGEEPDLSNGVGDVTSPVHLTSTYAVEGIDMDTALEDLDPDADQFLYSRLSNPTRHAVEKRLAALEGGDHAMAFASGTSAIVASVMAAVEPGDHVVAFEDLYGGTNTMLKELFGEKLNVAVDFVDATDPDAVRAATTDETALLWMETPTNPLLRLCDIEEMAAIADDHDALLGVDNTFMGPYFQRPLELGADVVVHSTTKYINGHSDSLGGVAVTSDDDYAEAVGFLQQVGMGNVLAPFDSYLVLRGLKTLPLRMRQHETNAAEVAAYLDSHDAVAAVHYPGLESHPQHDLADDQMDGHGGVLSFELDGDLADVERFVAALEEFTLAVSLGGVESLIEHPASMTHSPLPAEERADLGITDTLLRVSVGVEHPKDLLEDLERGFDAMEAGRADAPEDSAVSDASETAETTDASEAPASSD
ncbi:PLP-dependent aspartate aminotransferase family protein [Halorussus salilacus]|uniref:trans-sulfuration enzyme family protein n=1 Tax=Halorussus salilacus TaxID=2953750 RepID=UPI0020A00F09|nr:PLP-dependent aspartate aminotransferase family protein [Halorussus salilacus]USZ67334.1 PLP-dependent aspartate aminotransferase family protein [Halorussus salilacus]